VEPVKRLLLAVLLALVFVSPAAAANIVLTNTSSLPGSEIVDALPAFQRALDDDFAPVWPEARGSKLFVGAAPPGAWEIRIVDVADCFSCSGYHDVADGTPYAVVSAHDNWYVTLSHELWEMLVNPYGDRVAIVHPKQKAQVYALETADPVEGDRFTYIRPSASGRPIRISDFVTPAWFRRQAPGPWDFVHATKQPLQLLDDGYQIYLKNGSWAALFASGASKIEGRAKAKRWNARRNKSPIAANAASN
jgi:hypothetical protein